MDKNEFDQFDAANDDFDPREFLGPDGFDEDIDLNQFSDEELGLSPAEPEQAEEGPAPEDEYAPEGVDLDASPEFGEDFDLDADLDALLGEDAPEDLGVDYTAEDGEEFPAETDEPVEEEEGTPDDGQDGGNDPDSEDPNGDEDPQPRRRRTRKAEKSFKITLPKITMPNFFHKFIDLYFTPIRNKEMLEAPADPNNPRRRRRKSRSQIFKEVYLPPIIVCVTLVLVLSFLIGSISNFITDRQDEASRKQSQLASSASAAEAEEARIQQLLTQAEEYVAQYNYDAAIAALESVGDLSDYPDIAAKKTEYVNAQAALEEHKDPALIPNLGFNELIVDYARSQNDADLKGQYNRNFVTVDEFKKILQQLYDNGYVLVDFDSFVAESTDTSGNTVFQSKSIYLPSGKQPIMITETLTNYFTYMIDGNGDGEADSQGYGFASKLVNSNGSIKAEYVDADGNTLVGDYDLVPILESFIEEHPDFSYQGARAIVSFTGSQGILGYRITSDYVATKGQDYVDQEIADCKEVISLLKEKGYTLACNTYANKKYGTMSTAEISADLLSWTQKITPTLGEVDVFVFAGSSAISSYSDASFQQLYNAGFRYFIEEGTSTDCEVNTTYVRQSKFYVNGNTMAWKSTYYTSPTLIFDPAAVLDTASRGDVPN